MNLLKKLYQGFYILETNFKKDGKSNRCIWKYNKDTKEIFKVSAFKDWEKQYNFDWTKFIDKPNNIEYKIISSDSFEFSNFPILYNYNIVGDNDIAIKYEVLTNGKVYIEFLNFPNILRGIGHVGYINLNKINAKKIDSHLKETANIELYSNSYPEDYTKQSLILLPGNSLKYDETKIELLFPNIQEYSQIQIHILCVYIYETIKERFDAIVGKKKELNLSNNLSEQIKEEIEKEVSKQIKGYLDKLN